MTAQRTPARRFVIDAPSFEQDLGPIGLAAIQVAEEACASR